MTWGRLDDKFHRSRKVRKLRETDAGRKALGAWVFWWSWCLSDPELTGEVPASELPASDAKSAELLVSVGLWDRTEAGYKYHDFHEYNPNKDQRRNKLDADRARAAAKRGVARDVAADVANDSHSTSPPRARAGSGMGTYKLDTRDSVAVLEPVPPTGDARVDATNAALGLKQPVRVVR